VSGRLDIENCAVATVDAVGTEHESGHVVVEGNRIVAVGLTTKAGARYLGREEEIGSLEAGKLADIALGRLDGLGNAGISEPVAALVLGHASRVELMLVGGRVVVEDGELKTADETEITREIVAASRRLAGKAEEVAS